MDPNRQRRFAENVRENKDIGIGGHAFHRKGYLFPSHEQMDKFKKYNVPFDVDEKLRGAVIALNQVGYRTGGSCSGHKAGERGFIAVNPHPATDLFYNELKRKDPEKYQKAYQFYKKESAYSIIPINPSEVKSIIKRYTGVPQIYYQPTGSSSKGRVAYYHAFTFPSLANRWG